MSKLRRLYPRSWISILGLVVLIGGVASIGALLLAPMDAIHAQPKPSIEYTSAGAATDRNL